MDDVALTALKEEIARAQATANSALEAIRSRSAAERFCAAHPEFEQTPANAKILVDEMQERNLDLTSVESYETVFNDPAVRGNLTTAPEEPPKAAAEAEPAETKAKLTKSDREFLAEVERMSSAEYRQRIKEPAFVSRYNKLVPPTVVGG